jgi:small subunit ribosomal protein S1
VDDVIQAKVINVSRGDKKIGLSIKRLEETEEREIYKSYLDGRNGATSNLGEILKKEMLGRDSQAPSEDQAAGESLALCPKRKGRWTIKR